MKSTVLFILVCLLTACGSGSDSKPEPKKINQAPSLAIDAAATVIEYEQVILTGNATDIDGIIVSYFGQQISGPEAVLDDVNASTLSFDAPNVETDTKLTFKLTVEDNDKAQASAEVSVMISSHEDDIHDIDYADYWFRNCVFDNARENNWHLAKQFTSLKCERDVQRHKDIDTKGLEHFTNLIELNIHGQHDLHYIDLSALTQLTSLTIVAYEIGKIDISQQKKAEKVNNDWSIF